MEVYTLEKTNAKVNAIIEKAVAYIRENADNMLSYEVEVYIQKALQEAGCELLAGYFNQIASKDYGTKITTCDGDEMQRHNNVTVDFYSIFGKIKMSQQMYRKTGIKRISPHAADANVPDMVYSYRLQEFMGQLGVNTPFKKSSENIFNFFN